MMLTPEGFYSIGLEGGCGYYQRSEILKIDKPDVIFLASYAALTTAKVLQFAFFDDIPE